MPKQIPSVGVKKMIIDKIDINTSKCATIVTRICDECGKEERARISSIRRGRYVRNF